MPPRRSARLAAKKPVSYRTLAGLRPVRTRRRAPIRASKPLAALVKNIVKGVAETKYVAFSILDQTSNVITYTINNAAAWYPVVPPLAIGNGSFQRIGEKVTGIRGRTDFRFMLNDFGSAGITSQDIYVRIYYGSYKPIKQQVLLGAIDPMSLLDQGDGTTIAWDPMIENPSMMACMPTQKEVWTLKHKTFKLAKNQGTLTSGVAIEAPNVRKENYNFSWSWKHKAPLLYPSGGATAVQHQPTNFCPIFAMVAFTATGEALSANPSISATIRSHMWYKDV